MKPIVYFLGLLCAASAWAEHHDFVLTGMQKTIEVRPGDTVNVVGDSNQLNFVGSCTAIDLVGSNNVIRVQGKLGAIQIVGSGNTIHWPSGQTPPELQSLGKNNQLVPTPR